MAFDLDEEELRATRKINKADRDEIEVNEYVRTNKGNIGQVIGIFNGHCQAKYHIQFQGKVKVKRQYLSTHTIINHSKQLIDLIEVGDIVNGREVKHIAMFEGFPDYPKLIFVDETHLIPDDTCENDEIQTILTKESYMANCYKVGGEKC